jgi:uncharacterized membrane protein
MNNSNNKKTKNGNRKSNGNGRSNNKTALGDKASDKITTIIGSWTFIIIQSIIFTIWIILNAIAWAQHWDPYPFILLNLMLSFQAAYAAPIIMMSQNRAADKDRKKVEIDLAMDRKTDRDIAKIQIQLNRLENNKLKKILDILEEKK